MKKILFTFAALLFLCFTSEAQIHWTNNNGTGVWNDPDNWDPAQVPTDADEVVFDGNFASGSNDDCYIDGSEQALSITITNYSGTIEIDGGGSISVGESGAGGNVFVAAASAGFSGTVLVNNGAVLNIAGNLSIATGNTATFTINGELYVGQFSVLSGTFNAGGADAFECGPDQGGFGTGAFSMNGCTFTAPNSTPLLIVGQIANRTSGTFTANGGTVRNIIRANRNLGSGFTGANAFNNLTLGVSGAANRTLSLQGAVTVNGSLSFETSGSLYLIANNQQIDVSGNLDNSLNLATGNTGGSTNIRLVGTSSQSIIGNSSNSSGGNLPAVTITQGSGGTVALSGRINLARSLTINSNGAITANTSTLAFQDGTNTALLTGTTTTNLSLYNLLINKSGSSLSISSLSASWVTLSHLLTVTAGTFNTGSKLALTSTASNTSAQVDAVGGTISGSVRVDRFIPGSTGRKWRFLASSVTTSNFISNNWQQQIHITGSGTGGTNCPSLTTNSNGFDATSSNSASFLTYNEGSAAWASIANTGSTNLATGTGYRVFIRGARSQGCSLLDGTNATPNDVTLTATGTLATGTQVINLSRGTGSGWNLVGNPFQATIDWNSISRTNLASNSYYTFNPNGGVGGVGSYELYVGGSGGGANINAYIAPGHSFWVQAGSGGGSISIPESAKAVTQTTFTALFKTGNEDLFRVKLSDQLGYSDEVYASFKPGSSACYDNGVDVEKFQFVQGTGNIAFYSGCDATRLAYNTLEPASESRIDTMFMHVRVPSTTSATYTLTIGGLSTIASNIEVYLIDKYTNTFHNLRASNSYQFSTIASNASTQGANRFLIVYGGGLSLLPVKLTNFTAAKSGDVAVQVTWATASEINSKNFIIERSADGVSFDEAGMVQAKGKSSSASKYNFTDSKPLANHVNYYRLKLVDMDGTFSYSSVKSVDMNTSVDKKSEIVTALFPVPANDRLTAMLSENYMNSALSYSIYDLSGKQIGSSQVLDTDGSSKEVSIDLSVLGTGFYFLEITNQSGDIQRVKFIKE